MNEERDICLRDLALSICMRWRKIILLSILLAILFGGLSYIKSVKLNEEQERALSDVVTPEETMEALNLDDDAVARIQNYVSLKDTYKKLAYYNANSVLMQLDPNAIPTYKMTYAIKTKGNPTLIYDSYRSMLFSDDLCNKINEQISLELPTAYLQELVKVNSNSPIIKDVQFVVSGNGIDVPDSSMSMTVSTYFYDKDTCEKINSVVANYIQECTTELDNSDLESFSIIQISTTYTVAADTDLLTKQTSSINTMNSLKNTMDNLQKSMTEDEKAYLSAYQMQKSQEMAEVSDSTDISESKDEPELAKPSVNKKYVAIGALLGILLVAGFVALQYIFSNRIHYCDELEEQYQLHVFGCLNDEKKKRIKGIDAWLDRFKKGEKRQFSVEETLRMILAGIKIVSNKENVGKIYLTGCCIGDTEGTYIQKLSDMLKQESIIVESGNNILYDPDSLERMAACDAVILVERVEESTYKEIEKELEICKQQGISTLGAIVIE